MPSLTENNAKGMEIYIPEENPFVFERGVGEELFENMNTFSNYTAQVCAVTGKKESYSEVLSNAIRVAQNMKLKDIKPGDITCLLTYNNMEYASVILASFFIGAINSSMDPTSPLIDLTHCLRLTTPKIIFCGEELESTAEQAAKSSGISVEIVVFGKTEKNIPFSDFLIPNSDESEESFKCYEVTDPKSTACIHFSSGTTGLPKAVCVTHYGLTFVTHQFKEKFAMHKTTLITTNPFWISNMNSMITNIVSGDCRVVYRMFSEKNLLKYVQDHKVDILQITPANGAVLIQNPEYYQGYDLSCVKVVGTGGSTTHSKQYLEYMKIFPNAFIIGGYGMTETGGLILNLQLHRADELAQQQKECVGTPIPGFRYKVVDPETEEILGPNQEGELRVKYAGLMNSYYRNSKAYAEAFDSEGFLKTGDILYYNEDYKFYYITRIKDIFKYKGWHIPPLLIEAELRKHPNISQAVVFGVPTEYEGEHPTAAVILKDNENFNENEFVEFIKERLPDKYHLHGGVYLVDKFPITSTGKVQRRKLTEMVLKMKNKL